MEQKKSIKKTAIHNSVNNMTERMSTGLKFPDPPTPPHKSARGLTQKAATTAKMNQRSVNLKVGKKG